MNAGWDVRQVGDEVHVRPIGDDIRHTDEACPCDPLATPVTRGDGSIGVLVTHHTGARL